MFRLVTTSLPDGRCIVITAHGELDIAAANALTEAADAALLDTCRPNLVLDLSALTFMDSMGLHSVLACRERARARGGDIVLVNPGAQVARLLRITMVDRRIRTVASVHEAVG
ncbi:STAS domain-containing protein [Nonomuraea sp. NPDC050556]|uniref:STAS domain-containing protein n=1 Tax=Nonomuraea sp. NPDC050556 TaxID=3364369 RepID=UPI00379CC5D1